MAGADHAERARQFVRLGLGFYALLALAALAWRSGWSGESILYAAAAPPAAGVDWGAGIFWGVAGAGLLLGISHVITTTTTFGERMARILGEALGGLSVGQGVLLAAVSGVGEELFFRGALQPVVGFAAASVIFGVVHFAPRRDLLPWTGFAIAAGFVFGWLFESTGAIVAPVVAHFLVNAVNIPLLARRYGSGG